MRSVLRLPGRCNRYRQALQNQVISKDFAHAIMPLCNNISPMFLMGYVCNRYLNGQINTITVLAVIYLPQICYAILYYLLSKSSYIFYILSQSKKQLISLLMINQITEYISLKLQALCPNMQRHKMITICLLLSKTV